MMPSETIVRISPQAADTVRDVESRRLRSQLRNRIRLLASFPRMGVIDEDMPPGHQKQERRVSFVAPYGIRYRYDPTTNELYIDAITDERRGTSRRFL